MKPTNQRLHPEDRQLIENAQKWDQETLIRYMVMFAWFDRADELVGTRYEFIDAPDCETAELHADLLVRGEFANSVGDENGLLPSATYLEAELGISYVLSVTPLLKLLRDATTAEACGPGLT